MDILATIDNEPGCKQVVETAEDLAAGLEHDLVVLHVISGEGDEGEVRAEVEAIVEEATTGDISPKIRLVPESAGRDVPTGRTARTVLKVADELDPAYLVIGSRKRTTVGKILLGSVSRLVLMNAEVPVVTVEQTT